MAILTIYTDIDTLFDTRRGILEHLVKESGRDDFQWKMYEEIYKGRTLDYFEKPEYGITHEQYLTRFKARSIKDWVDDKCCYFYPSNVINAILPVVRSIEFGSHQTIQVAKMELTVNTYPFQMSDKLLDELHRHLLGTFKIKIDIHLIYVPFTEQTATFINGFNYVFRYGHLINPEMRTWFETYPQCRLFGVKIIVPALLAKAESNDPIFESLNKDPPKSRIEKMSALQGGKCIYIPLDKSVFDYIDGV